MPLSLNFHKHNCLSQANLAISFQSCTRIFIPLTAKVKMVKKNSLNGTQTFSSRKTSQSSVWVWVWFRTGNNERNSKSCFDNKKNLITVFPRLFLFSHQKGAIIRGRRLFQILFTGSRALNICSIFPLNEKSNHIKETEHGVFSVPSLVPWLIFNVDILGVVTDQFFCMDQTPLQPHPRDLPLWVSIAGYL